jgi:hypothetical protein
MFHASIKQGFIFTFMLHHPNKHEQFSFANIAKNKYFICWSIASSNVICFNGLAITVDTEIMTMFKNSKTNSKKLAQHQSLKTLSTHWQNSLMYLEGTLPCENSCFFLGARDLT